MEMSPIMEPRPPLAPPSVIPPPTGPELSAIDPGTKGKKPDAPDSATVTEPEAGGTSPDASESTPAAAETETVGGTPDAPDSTPTTEDTTAREISTEHIERNSEEIFVRASAVSEQQLEQQRQLAEARGESLETPTGLARHTGCLDYLYRLGRVQKGADYRALGKNFFMDVTFAGGRKERVRAVGLTADGKKIIFVSESDPSLRHEEAITQVQRSYEDSLLANIPKDTRDPVEIALRDRILSARGENRGRTPKDVATTQLEAAKALGMITGDDLIKLLTPATDPELESDECDYPQGSQSYEDWAKRKGAYRKERREWNDRLKTQIQPLLAGDPIPSRETIEQVFEITGYRPDGSAEFEAHIERLRKTGDSTMRALADALEQQSKFFSRVINNNEDGPWTYADLLTTGVISGRIDCGPDGKVVMGRGQAVLERYAHLKFDGQNLQQSLAILEQITGRKIDVEAVKKKYDQNNAFRKTLQFGGIGGALAIFLMMFKSSQEE